MLGFIRKAWGVMLACCLLWTANVHAQTSITGSITTASHWTSANSPYLLSGEVVIQNTAELLVDAGVTIYMGPGARLTVQSGAVRALGTEQQPIQVLSNKTREGVEALPGDWGQWVFEAGTRNTRLEHVVFEHGSGLVVRGAAPVFNFVEIRHQQGAAITVDLMASLSGVGNAATGNTINAIAVPPGDITGTARWEMRGIPYLVTSGTVSVGVSPAVDQLTPSQVQQGQAQTLTLNGKRLEALSGLAFSSPHLSADVFAGGTSQQRFVQVQVPAEAALGPVDVRVMTDHGEVFLPKALQVIAPQPAITSLTPAKVVAGQGPSEITVNGRHFSAQSEVLFNAAPVPTRYVSAGSLVATLPVQTAIGNLSAQVRTPSEGEPGQYLTSNTATLAVEAPVPPVVSFEPTPIAVPPDNRPRLITLKLSKPDYRDHSFALSVSDASKASVSPTEVTIPAGQTQAQVTLTPLSVGTTSLIAQSPELARTTAPVFVTTDFGAINTAYALPVGVVIEQTATPQTQEVTLTPAPVGVSVGGVLTSATPATWLRDATTVLTIRGQFIAPDAQLSVVPADGVTLSDAQVSADGHEMQVQVGVSPTASLGMRRLVMRTANGQDILFADWRHSQARVVSGLPHISSVEPNYGLTGSTISLRIRGRHLDQATLRILPAEGLQVDAAPQVSADGTSLTARIDVASTATTGPRVVQVLTSAGATPETANESNTLFIASQVQATYTPVASALVGVVLGSAAPEPVVESRTRVGELVGVLVGAGVTEVSPRVGVVGEEVQVTVTGQGLHAISEVAFVPSDGLAVQGAPVPSADGKTMTFTVRVAPEAALGLRRLKLLATGMPVTFSRSEDGVFLVSAPLPELQSVAPTVLVTGQSAVTMTVHGRHLRNVQAVRIEPGEGIVVSGPFNTQDDGTALTFNASVAAGAASGVRAVVVTTAAGESQAVVQPGNMVRIASELGDTYAAIASPVVGVQVGSEASEPVAVPGTLLSPPVGVQVAVPPVTVTRPMDAVGVPVGVVVGAAAYRVEPDGLLQGNQTSVTVVGQGLERVQAVSVLPATGLLLDAPVVAPDGRSLTFNIAAAPDAPLGARALRLQTSDAQPVVFLSAALEQFGIGRLPTLNSVSPIVLEQSQGYNLVIRGSNLSSVMAVQLEGGAGVQVLDSGIEWSQDTLGERLSVPVRVDANADLGARVLRFKVPGGMTGAEPTPANSLTVVAPQ